MCPRKRPNILILSGYFRPHEGGHEKFAEEIALRLAYEGYNTSIVSTNTDGAVEEESPRKNLRVLRLPSWDMIGKTFPCPIPNARTLALLKKALDPKPDIVITNTRFFPTTLLGIFLGHLARSYLLHIEHGTRHTVSGNGIIEALGRSFDHLMGRVLRKSDNRAGVSKAAVRFLAHIGVGDAGIIYNGINVDKFEPNTKRRSNGGSDATTIGFLGRIIMAKGVQDLLQVLPRILKHHPDVRVVIAGEGPYIEDLKEMAKDMKLGKKVRFLGKVEHSKVPSLLRTFDIFVNPSFSEGLPTSVLEAGATGLPIVATKVGGTEEILVDGESGLLYKAGDQEALEEAIEAYLNDPVNAGQMGERARTIVLEKFDYSNSFKQLLRMIPC